MTNSHSTFEIVQTVFPQHKATITASSLDEAHLSERTVDLFLSSIVDGKIGLAPTYDKQQRLKSIAFASLSQVLLITFSIKQQNLNPKREILSTKILMNHSLKKYGFNMDKFATFIFTNLSLKIVEAVDILSLRRKPRHLISTMILALGEKSGVNEACARKLFRKGESHTAEPLTVATQAWVAYQAALVHPASNVPSTINTTIFSAEVQSPSFRYRILFIWQI